MTTDNSYCTPALAGGSGRYYEQESAYPSHRQQRGGDRAAEGVCREEDGQRARQGMREPQNNNRTNEGLLSKAGRRFFAHREGADTCISSHILLGVLYVDPHLEKTKNDF